MFSRYYTSKLDSFLKPGRVLVLYGARQVGKTTLLKEYLRGIEEKFRLESGEDFRFQHFIESKDIAAFKEYASEYQLLVIDEAQKIAAIGESLKLFVDHIPELKIIVTGSASFELAQQVGEPLAGRKTTRILYPVAQLELQQDFTDYDIKARLEEYLIYGSYPEILKANTLHNKKEYLQELTGSYLFKDILELENIKHPKLLFDLLKLLAFQIGKDVSISNLAKNLQIDAKTVNRYLELLEKTFVIRRIGGFSRNLRKEVSKSNRYYFIDNGIRNSIISNYNKMTDRNDIGVLWQNFLVIEREKKNEMLRNFSNHYFWRTYDQAEIDLIEEGDGKISAFEMKWGKGDGKIPIAFRKAYPKADYTTINQANYLEFVGQRHEP